MCLDKSNRCARHAPRDGYSLPDAEHEGYNSPHAEREEYNGNTPGLIRELSPLDAIGLLSAPGNQPLAVVPVLVGPLQVLVAMLPIILTALGRLVGRPVQAGHDQAAGALAVGSESSSWWSWFAAIGGGVYVGSLVLASSRENVAKIETAKADWALWRGGLDRRGYVPGKEDDPGHDRVVWSFSTKDHQGLCVVAVRGGQPGLRHFRALAGLQPRRRHL